jgi:hypothetical protein
MTAETCGARVGAGVVRLDLEAWNSLYGVEPTHGWTGRADGRLTDIIESSTRPVVELTSKPHFFFSIECVLCKKTTTKQMSRERGKKRNRPKKTNKLKMTNIIKKRQTVRQTEREKMKCKKGQRAFGGGRR